MTSYSTRKQIYDIYKEKKMFKDKVEHVMRKVLSETKFADDFDVTPVTQKILLAT